VLASMSESRREEERLVPIALHLPRTIHVEEGRFYLEEEELVEVEQEEEEEDKEVEVQETTLDEAKEEDRMGR